MKKEGWPQKVIAAHDAFEARMDEVGNHGHTPMAQVHTDALRLVPQTGWTVGQTLSQLDQEAERDGLPAGTVNRLKIAAATIRSLAAAPASPLPGGGPHERWSILNHLGELWTPENFDTERQATAFLDSWKRDNPKMELSEHRVIPVLVTMTAAPTGDA